jgi:hypothetical protein
MHAQGGHGCMCVCAYRARIYIKRLHGNVITRTNTHARVHSMGWECDYLHQHSQGRTAWAGNVITCTNTHKGTQHGLGM